MTPCRRSWLPGTPDLPFSCRYNLACGTHLAGSVSWIGLVGAAAATCAAYTRTACLPAAPPHTQPGACISGFTQIPLSPPLQASLLLFWLRFHEPPCGTLAKVFMGTQAAVFGLELLWRRPSLRQPRASFYTRWREALVAVLRLNEGLLGSRCLVGSGLHGFECVAWAAACWTCGASAAAAGTPAVTRPRLFTR